MQSFQTVVTSKIDGKTAIFIFFSFRPDFFLSPGADPEKISTVPEKKGGRSVRRRFFRKAGDRYRFRRSAGCR